MTGKLPINIDHLLRQRTIEGERIEYNRSIRSWLESAECSAHRLRLRQRLPQPRRRLHRAG